MEPNKDNFEIEISYPEEVDVDNRIDKILCDLSVETLKPKDIEISFTMRDFMPGYIENPLYVWWNEFLDDIYNKTSKGYMRILSNIITQKTEKYLNQACEYLKTEGEIDERLIKMFKKNIQNKLSHWAVEQYNDLKMWC